METIMNNKCNICEERESKIICPNGFKSCIECFKESLEINYNDKNRKTLKCHCICNEKHLITFEFILEHMELFNTYMKYIKDDYNKVIDYMKYQILNNNNFQKYITLFQIIKEKILDINKKNDVIQLITIWNNDIKIHKQLLIDNIYLIFQETKNNIINEYNKEDIKDDIKNIFNNLILKSSYLNNHYIKDINITNEELYNLLLKYNNELIYNYLITKSNIEDNIGLFYDDIDININILNCCKPFCHGLLNKDYICMLCNTKTCPNCLCELTENHNCNIINNKSICYLINKDNENNNKKKGDIKQCPLCHKIMEKKGGCRDMTCLYCGCIFNWDNLEIQTNNTNEYLETHINEIQKDNIRISNIKRKQYLGLDLICGNLLNSDKCQNIFNELNINNKILNELSYVLDEHINKQLYIHNITSNDIIKIIIKSLYNKSLNLEKEIDEIYKKYIFEYNYNKIIDNVIKTYHHQFIDFLCDYYIINNIINKLKEDNNFIQLYNLKHKNYYNPEIMIYIDKLLKEEEYEYKTFTIDQFNKNNQIQEKIFCEKQNIILGKWIYKIYKKNSFEEYIDYNINILKDILNYKSCLYDNNNEIKFNYELIYNQNNYYFKRFKLNKINNNNYELILLSNY